MKALNKKLLITTTVVLVALLLIDLLVVTLIKKYWVVDEHPYSPISTVVILQGYQYDQKALTRICNLADKVILYQSGKGLSDSQETFILGLKNGKEKTAIPLGNINDNDQISSLCTEMAKSFPHEKVVIISPPHQSRSIRTGLRNTASRKFLVISESVRNPEDNEDWWQKPSYNGNIRKLTLDYVVAVRRRIRGPRFTKVLVYPISINSKSHLSNSDQED